MFVSNTKVAASATYSISNSLRFRSSATAYLSRTLGAPTSGTTWTWSGWVKRGALGGTQGLQHGFSASNNQGGILINSDVLQIIDFPVSSNCNLVTTQVFRDPSAWYHVVVACDTTQATAANRVLVYVNGVQVTAFSTATYPTQNTTFRMVASGNTGSVGRYFDGTTSTLDGYMAEVRFIDGQALTPASFGQTDSNGVWVPKSYTGTYGTNGFYLKFNDGSNTTNLCLDRSGNGNNWTPNNISLTAGATYDWMVDTPTNNYGVINRLRTNVNNTIINGNLTNQASATSSQDSIFGSFGMSTGKWYWEVNASSISAADLLIGVADETVSLTRPTVAGTAYEFDIVSALKFDGSTFTAYGSTLTTTDTLGIALDCDGGTITFYKNGVSMGVAFSSGIAGKTWFANMWKDGTSASYTAHFNFGQRPFANTPPTGYKAPCTANLPAVTIQNPKKHFDVVTWTGNGGSQSVTGLQFSPEFTWHKGRSSAFSHILINALTGVSKILQSNTTNAEQTTTYMTSLDSGGFTVTNTTGDNANGTTAVAWNWKANGAGVTNNAGSITSTVSANTTSGFSVVTYTGTGANATVGHGLGVAPKMVIVKNRAGPAGAVGWAVYHSGMNASPATGYLFLNTTAAFATLSTVWNNTAPTSSVFSVGAASAVNNSGTDTYVAYCFAEVPGFSKFGSYTGNGSADGPFVYCGFRPRYLVAKRTDATGGSWHLVDTARNPVNPMSVGLFPDLSIAEAADFTADLTANGFKIRNTQGELNASGGTYIFMAFAENPFGGSNVAPAPAR